MQLSFQNSCSSKIWVAIMWYSPDTCRGDDRDWEKRGWWGIDPDATVNTNVYTGNDYWYFYAEAADGRLWNGPFSSDVDAYQAFDACWGTEQSDYDREAWETVGFREKYWPNAWALSRLTVSLH